MKLSRMIIMDCVGGGGGGGGGEKRASVVIYAHLFVVSLISFDQSA